MEFRPCIDIHNGKVKQIVGSSLKDEGDSAVDNFVSECDSAYYAKLYKNSKISGGHIILLNKSDSPYYKETKAQALLALRTYPNGLQVGGGITADNAKEFLDAGASHVIVTSYVFSNGKVDYDNLRKLSKTVGREHLVLDLSCRRKPGEDGYYIVTDRWQNFTEEKITEELLDTFLTYCSEFLIHAVDMEGKANGIETELVQKLGAWGKIPITYAGGVHSYEDLRCIRELGKNKMHVTIGSALDIFGGPMKWEEVLKICREN